MAVAAAVGVLVLVNKHARQPAWAKLGDKSPTDSQQLPLPLRNRGHDIVAPRLASPRLVGPLATATAVNAAVCAAVSYPGPTWPGLTRCLGPSSAATHPLRRCAIAHLFILILPPLASWPSCSLALHRCPSRARPTPLTHHHPPSLVLCAQLPIPARTDTLVIAGHCWSMFRLPVPTATQLPCYPAPQPLVDLITPRHSGPVPRPLAAQHQVDTETTGWTGTYPSPIPPPALTPSPLAPHARPSSSHRLHLPTPRRLCAPAP
jgi:hypothetical protein